MRWEWVSGCRSTLIRQRGEERGGGMEGEAVLIPDPNTVLTDVKYFGISPLWHWLSLQTQAPQLWVPMGCALVPAPTSI